MVCQLPDAAADIDYVGARRDAGQGRTVAKIAKLESLAGL
jgi:hypothetical protein